MAVGLPRIRFRLWAVMIMIGLTASVVGCGSEIARSVTAEPVQTPTSAPVADSDQNSLETNQEELPTPEPIGDGRRTCAFPGSSGGLGNVLLWLPDSSGILVDVGLGLRTVGRRLYSLDAGGTQVSLFAELSDEIPIFGYWGQFLPFADMSQLAARVVFLTCAYSTTYPPTGMPIYQSEIATARLDGTDQKRLTRNLKEEAYPVWSSDGTRIAFLRAEAPHISLVIMSADGTREETVLSSPSPGLVPFPPVWSPQGDQLLVALWDDQYRVVLHLVDTSDREPEMLSVTQGRGAWSPDGRHIAFSKPQDDEVGLYVIDLEDSSEQFVTNIAGMDFQGWVNTIAWSPDGKRLLFGCVPSICTVNLATNSVVRFPVLRASDDVSASWSPDGSRVAVRYSDSATTADTTIYTATPDATDILLLAVPSIADGVPKLIPAQSASTDLDSEMAGCLSQQVAISSGPDAGIVKDCQVLLRLRDTLAGSTGLNWNSNIAIEEWDGITISGTPPRVTELSLSQRGLRGFIPSQVGELDRLTVLDLERNALGGLIPSSIGQLTELVRLNVGYNLLSGSIPRELGNLTNLGFADFRGQFLTGCVPPEFDHSTLQLRLAIYPADPLPFCASFEESVSERDARGPAK